MMDLTLNQILKNMTGNFMSTNWDQVLGLGLGLLFAVFVGFYLLSALMDGAFSYRRVNFGWMIANVVIGVAIVLVILTGFKPFEFQYHTALGAAIAWFFIGRTIRISCGQ